MNQRPLSAAYEHMTNHQLAAVAYAYIGNELESLRIQSVVPRKTYSMLDAEFNNALENIHTATLHWSCEYWRLQYVYSVDVLRMAYAHIQDELKNEDDCAELIAKGQRMIAAHFAALKEVCGVRGIDYQTVLKRNYITEQVDQAWDIDLEYKTVVIAALETYLVIGE